MGAQCVFLKINCPRLFTERGRRKMIYLPYFAEKRGRLDVARIGIETRFPLGFYRLELGEIGFPIVVPQAHRAAFVLSTGRGEDEGHSQKQPRVRIFMACAPIKQAMP